ncbi:hypothetical protein V5279_19445 [Bradyrhizobium sp. 26S5]|nr:hypothetical protein [Bradyrhizobium sp. 2S1]MCK7669592.1 hypothetical protein [Bradyrhizobium sp. 2S1]
MATAENQHLIETLPTLDYDVISLPKVSSSERVDFVLATLGGCITPVA